MQLLLYKTGKHVRAYYFRADVCRASYLAQTFAGTAKTFEGLGHIPFSRWIKETHFIAFTNGLQSYYLHCICIEEYVGIATVVNILQVPGLQHDMLIHIYL